MEEAAAETQTMLNEFCAAGWQPEQIEAIAGALVYTQYNIFIRHMMKLIQKQQGRTQLDTSRDYDFTDLGAIRTLARVSDIAGEVPGGSQS